MQLVAVNGSQQESVPLPVSLARLVEVCSFYCAMLLLLLSRSCGGRVDQAFFLLGMHRLLLPLPRLALFRHLLVILLEAIMIFTLLAAKERGAGGRAAVH